jgi:hypothetical protein
MAKEELNKVCKQCNESKPESKFNTSGKPVRLKSTGKIKQYRKTLCCVCERLKHKDRINATARAYYHKKMQDPEYAEYKRNKERAWGQTDHGKKAKAEYRIEYNNRPEVIAFKKSDEGKALQSKRNREYKQKHDPDGSKAYARNKIWRKKNKQHLIEARRIYEKTPKAKLKKAARVRLNQVLLKYTPGKKFGSSKYNIDWNIIVQSLIKKAKLLGETISSLRSKNYEVDHIIPCCLYNLEDVEEVAKCFSKYNLRWLPAKENSAKAGLLRQEDLEIVKTLPKSIYPKRFSLEQYANNGGSK